MPNITADPKTRPNRSRGTSKFSSLSLNKNKKRDNSLEVVQKVRAGNAAGSGAKLKNSNSSPPKPEYNVISKYFPKITACSDPSSPSFSSNDANITSQLSNKNSSGSTDWTPSALSDSSECVTSFGTTSCQIESPYRNLMSEIKSDNQQKQSIDDSLLSDENSDFKASSAMAASALKKSKILQLKPPKSVKNPRKVTKNARKAKKLLGKNKIPYVYKSIESFKNNCAGDDVNPEHLQMALALSKSSYEAENGKRLPPSLDDSNTTFAYQEKQKTAHHDSNKSAEFKKALERFGFKCQNSDRSRSALESYRQSKVVKKAPRKSRYCYITPILKLRTEEERQSLITSKVSLILGQNHNRSAEENDTIDEGQDKIDVLYSEFLQSILAKRSQRIFQLNSKNLSELGEDGKLFYVTGLEMSPVKENCCGCLLKDWSKIPGRDPSPIRNSQDSARFSASKSEKNSEIDDDSEIPGNSENSEKPSCDSVEAFTSSQNLTENSRKIDESPKLDEKQAKNSPKIDTKLSKIVRCVSPDLFASSDEETSDNVHARAPPVVDFCDLTQYSDESENPTSDVRKQANTTSDDANSTDSAHFYNINQSFSNRNEENSKYPTSDVTKNSNLVSDLANSVNASQRHTSSTSFCSANRSFHEENDEIPENPTSDVTEFPNDIVRSPGNEHLSPGIVQVDGASYIPNLARSSCHLSQSKSKNPTSDVTRLRISNNQNTGNFRQNYDSSSVEKLSDDEDVCSISVSHDQVIVDFCDLTQSSDNRSSSPENDGLAVNSCSSQQASQLARICENPTSDVSEFPALTRNKPNFNGNFANFEQQSHDKSLETTVNVDPTSDVSEIPDLTQNKPNFRKDFGTFEEQFVVQGYDESFGARRNVDPTSDVAKNSISTQIAQYSINSNDQCATETYFKSNLAEQNKITTSDVAENTILINNEADLERNFDSSHEEAFTESCANSNPTSDVITSEYNLINSVANTSRYSDLNVTDYVNRMLNADRDLEKFGPASTSHLDDLGVKFLDPENDSLDRDVLSQESSLSQEEGIVISDDELNYSCNITSKKRYELSDSDENDDEVVREPAEAEKNLTSDCLDDSFGRLLSDSAVVESLEHFNNGFGAQLKAPNVQFSKEIDTETPQEQSSFDTLRQKKISENKMASVEIGAQRKAPTNSEISTIVAIETPQKQSKFDTCQKETPDNNLLIIKTKNVTPMADYDRMNTPVIAKELHKFGLKPLKRQRGAKLLKYIYESTHPLIDGAQRNEFYEDGEDQDGGDQKVTKKRKLLAVDEDKVNVKSPSVGGNWQQVDIVGDLISDSELETGLIFERKSSKKIFTCQVPLQIVWHNFVSCNPQIKENILLYEPLQLEVIHAMLKEQGFKFNVQDLLTFLDKKCITVRTGNQGQGGHRTRRKKQ